MKGKRKVHGKELIKASELRVGLSSHSADWSPATLSLPTKNEIFYAQENASGAGFALSLARKHTTSKPWLWVQDKVARKRGGVPHIHGFPPNLRDSLHYVAANSVEDALFALEEGLRCAALSFVIGELSGDPRALGFTTSKRLAVASETHQVPLYLLRVGAQRSLSAARMRWAIEPRPSVPSLLDARAPMEAAYAADLFRSRMYRPGSWTVSHDSTGTLIAAPTDRIDLVAASGHQPVGTARA